ncbi:MAG: 5'-nucleotidase C-terminal domain-containing protein [Taibaiella sp.]|nr:5'-nucleotidase C-terminal domain-containing protein [Taibaiella sp.]
MHIHKMKKASLFIALFIAALSSCAPKKYAITSYEAQLRTISDTIPADAGMNRFMATYKARLDSVMNEVIGTALVPLTKAQPESTMGNFAADAQLEAGKKIDNLVTLSVVNYGGIRIPFLPAGNITKGKIYEIMPFDNLLTVIEVPGTVLQTFCDHMANRKGWPISGFSYKIKNGKAIDVEVGGEAIRPNAIYKLVTSDYIANGGDECEFLAGLKKQSSSILLRDAIMTKVMNDSRQNKGIEPKLEKRVNYAE